MAEHDAPSNPWDELAQQASRLPLTNRDRQLERDRSVRAAVMHGTSVRDLAEQLGTSVQAIYQALDRADQDERVRISTGYAQTIAALEAMTDAVAFERLASLLLAEFIPDLRPTQPQADRGRDAVAGVRRLEAGEELIVTMSLRKDWNSKIEEDLGRLADQGYEPRAVYAVTNRSASARRIEVLQESAATHGWSLSVFDGRWLAAQLTRPEHLDLREEFLRLPHPRPPLFLRLDEFEKLLQKASTPYATFVGRAPQLAEVADRIDEGKTVILEAAGGLGKSRLLVELARRQEDTAWWFVRDGLPFEREMAAEIGAGDPAVVVIDDAHRRADLRALLAALERRDPRPRLILVTRPGFALTVEGALDGMALGTPVRVRLPRLSRAEVAELLEAPPFDVRYGGLRTAIVHLAEGSPQIAAIAGELASRGLALHELSGDEVMRSYVAALLRASVGESRERLALVALVAAIGRLDQDAMSSAAAADLLGMALPHMRRELDELADRGILVEDGDGLTIKPDLLAERILLGCFFDRSWRPALNYDDVYERFASQSRLAILSALGQALRWAPKDHRAAPALATVRRDVLAHCTRASSTDALVDAAELAGAVAPGMPALAAEAADLLLDRLPDAPDELERAVSAILALLQRTGSFVDGWRRLLALAQRVFAAPASEDARKQVIEALTSVHRRVPVDESASDGRVLAGVQAAMADLTEAHWRRESVQAGAAEAIAVAARALLTVIFEVHREDAANPNQIHLISVGVPASDFTARCLRTGAELLLRTLRDLPATFQREQVEALRGLAHPALGFAGPFGLKLAEETSELVNGIFDEVVEPWFTEHVSDLPLPVAADVLELFEWRTRFGRPRAAIPESDELREYRALIQPSSVRELDMDIREQQRREQETANEYSQHLRRSPEPLSILDRWAAWLGEHAEITGESWHAVLPMTLEAAAAADPDFGEEAVNHLLSGESLLLSYATGAMTAVLNADGHEEIALNWAGARSAAGRRALAWAAPALEETLQRQVVEQLAAAPEKEVRSTVARALRYRTDLADWRFRVALRVAATDGDLRLLREMLEGLTEPVGEHAEAQLSPEDALLVKEALLEVARNPTARDGHDIADALGAFCKLGTDVLWEWVWERIDRIRGRDATERLGLHGEIPDEVLGLASSRVGDRSAQEQLERALDEVETTGDWLVERVLIGLIRALDDGSDAVLSRLARWASGGPQDQHRMREVLASPCSWELFKTRAAVVVTANPDEDTVNAVVWAREPMSFVGSRAPYYEAVKQEFAAWRDDPDGNLVRVAVAAEKYFDTRISEARDHEQEMLSRY